MKGCAASSGTSLDTTGRVTAGDNAGTDAPRVAVLERKHPPGHAGALVERLVPALMARGAAVALVRPSAGALRIDQRPGCDLALLKSGEAVALHAAAAAEAWGVPVINTTAATRLAQDRIAWAIALQGTGSMPTCAPLWIAGGGREPRIPTAARSLERLVVKSRRGSRGEGLWHVRGRDLCGLARRLPAGPYVVMEWVGHEGEDLKVYVAGDWVGAIRRPFPASSLAEKRGRRVEIDGDVRRIVRDVGTRLGLHLYGCDLVAGPDGWRLVDVNAFPGYKGVDEAADAIADLALACVTPASTNPVERTARLEARA